MSWQKDCSQPRLSFSSASTIMTYLRFTPTLQILTSKIASDTTIVEAMTSLLFQPKFPCQAFGVFLRFQRSQVVSSSGDFTIWSKRVQKDKIQKIQAFQAIFAWLGILGRYCPKHAQKVQVSEGFGFIPSRPSDDD